MMCDIMNRRLIANTLNQCLKTNSTFQNQPQLKISYFLDESSQWIKALSFRENELIAKKFMSDANSNSGNKT